jgi:3-methylcrotonyl-CoA carboxylase beta subunit
MERSQPAEPTSHWPQLDASGGPNAAQFAANAASMDELVAELRRLRAEAALGGSAASRERHVSRGKLLPRQRVESLLDPGSPFLELSPLAAHGMYDGEAPGAGIITGVGRVAGRVRDRRQRRHGQGRHVLPDDGQEAPPGPGGRAREPAAVRLPRRLRRRVPARAGQVFPDREHFGRIFYNQATMSGRASRRSPRCSGRAPPAAPTCRR